ncbi:hypothetical protein [Spirillospora sp. NPDC048824]|uniref:hypothetical protein n=1 Tax=Spirillospora sp. NPDC048824 TaxID=3364526 RepID=UPI0037216A18
MKQETAGWTRPGAEPGTASEAAPITMVATAAGRAAGGTRAAARPPVLVDASGPRLPVVERARLRPRYRTILAVDIEGSTARTDAVKAELRRVLYRLLEEAFNRSGIEEGHREAYVDRGDGMLVLVHPHDEVPKTLLLYPVVPVLSALLAEYNSGPMIAPGGDRRIRIRVVVHAGEVHNDGRGNFGEALDVAFRLLDSPATKNALRRTGAPLALVVSDDIYHSIVRHGYEGIRAGSYTPVVHLRVTGRTHQGWVHDAAGLASEGPGASPGLAARTRRLLNRLAG